MEKIYLLIPIFGMFEIDSLEDATFSENSSDYIKDGYGLEARKKIHENLKWAEQNPAFDFKSLLKDAPVPDKLKFSNQEVFEYLMEFKQFMEDKNYGLLTDKRSPKEF